MSGFVRMVEMPPIGDDGRCVECGQRPFRETGRCGCFVRPPVNVVPDPEADHAAAVQEWTEHVERIGRLTDALRQLGIPEARISDVADGRTDIDGRVPDVAAIR